MIELNTAKINSAITEYLSIGWIDESKTQITEKFGAEITAHINDIMTEIANNYMHSYIGDSLEDAIAKLTVEYPYLTNASSIRLLDFAAIWWKSE